MAGAKSMTAADVVEWLRSQEGADLVRESLRWLVAELMEAEVCEQIGAQRKCAVIAHGVHETGRREIIGLDVGEAETEAFWTDFLRGLVARGLVGVQLVISDAHEGLKKAIARVLGAPWQRCTVHFLRDCVGQARKDQHGLLGALIRPIFNQP